jgi:hypothetical protein
MNPKSKIFSEVDEDLHFDLQCADDKLMRIASLRDKYSRILLSARTKMNELDLKRKRIRAELYEYYIVDYNVKLDRRDIPTFIDGDTKYQAVLNEINKLDEKMEYIDSILKSLSDLNYTIPAGIKWAIFKAGG